MPSWLQDNLASTRAALVSLNLLNDLDFIKANKELFAKFVRSCFKGDCYSNAKREEGSVYGTAYAVEVLRYALGKKENEKLITNGSIDQLKEEETISITKFLSNCTQSGEKDKGVSLHDKPAGRDSILVIYLVRRLLWSLNKDDDVFFGLMPLKNIKNYLEKCYCDAGFKSNPSVNTPDISTTFFTLSLIGGNKGEKPYEEIVPELHKKFFEEKKPAIREFLEKCWDSKKGGFRPSAEASLPTLKDTYFAMQTMGLLGLEFFEEEKTSKMTEEKPFPKKAKKRENQ